MTREELTILLQLLPHVQPPNAPHTAAYLKVRLLSLWTRGRDHLTRRRLFPAAPAHSDATEATNVTTASRSPAASTATASTSSAGDHRDARVRFALRAFDEGLVSLDALAYSELEAAEECFPFSDGTLTRYVDLFARAVLRRHLFLSTSRGALPGPSTSSLQMHPDTPAALDKGAHVHNAAPFFELPPSTGAPSETLDGHGSTHAGPVEVPQCLLDAIPPFILP